MPGDPLRAKYIADTYLEDARCFNTVRNMLGYTGTYKGREISVMGGGMGMPSVGIYTYELYHRYEVEAIIRIGSAGALRDDIQLKDVVIGMGACTDSNYAAQYQLPGTFAPIAAYGLLEKAVNTARAQGVSVKVGNILSSDIFYNDDDEVNAKWRKMGVMEMCIRDRYQGTFKRVGRACDRNHRKRRNRPGTHFFNAAADGKAEGS